MKDPINALGFIVLKMLETLAVSVGTITGKLDLKTAGELSG